MNKIAKITNIVLYVLLVLGVLFSAIALFGGEVKDDVNKTPEYLDTVLNYTYFLFFASAAVVIVLEVINTIFQPANSKKSLFSFAIIVAILLLAYMFSDGTPLVIMGYEGADNIPSMLKVTDTGLYAFYILIFIAVVSIFYTEIARIFK